MKMSKNILLHITFLYLCLHIDSTINVSNDHDRKPYIVYMGEVTQETLSLTDAHHSLLSEAIGDETLARNSIIHSYGKSFNGFAARLLPNEAKLLSQKKGVVSVFPNKVQKLLTTRSWDFIGMPETVSRDHLTESNIIIALLDTGVWVESPSFNDKGFGPPPPKWKGKCAKDINFTGCNNKVIGVQYYNLAKNADPTEITPVDTDGHGSHTASTAAGVSVKGASLYGIAEGIARGGVPSARIASYKVCWSHGCEDVDVLAAFDQAIADGVDIISVSLGGLIRSIIEDSIAIGSFHALKKGIMTVCAAGNDGPYLGTVVNTAPWILTVAASTTDRKFETSVKLGNGQMFTGSSLNTLSLKKNLYPLTSGAKAQIKNPDGNSSACEYGTLSENKVKGRIVYCQGEGGNTAIEKLGGIGTIMISGSFQEVVFPSLTPTTYVALQDGLKIGTYINSTQGVTVNTSSSFRSAQAVIYKSRTVNTNTKSPAIGYFSSRGPQQISPQILKPDIAAPGVNILAAYTKYSTMTGGDKRVVKFNVLSGTSMACPHVSGAAAYVKTFRPDWSVSAIKSALMTTAKSMKINLRGGALLSGSGEIYPTKALSPGLVYDDDLNSYISFLCKEGYNNSAIALLTGNKNQNCSAFNSAKGNDGLNYPSIHLQLMKHKNDISAVFYRSVTNVGVGKSVYTARVKEPKGLTITVSPNVLTFDKIGQKMSFKVILKGKFLLEKSWYLSGSVVWSDLKHIVKSPVLVFRPSL